MMKCAISLCDSRLRILHQYRMSTQQEATTPMVDVKMAGGKCCVYSRRLVR